MVTLLLLLALLIPLRSFAQPTGGGGGGTTIDVTSEAALEQALGDINVFTDNDGSLDEDDLTDNVISDLSNVGSSCDATDNQIMIGNGTFYIGKTIPVCNATTEKIIFDGTDFSCETDVSTEGTGLTDSASLSDALSDETGTGLAVFGTSPTIATPLLTLQDGNGAAPTTDGQIKYDRTTERLQAGDGSGTSEFVKVGTLTDTKVCIWDSTGKAIVCNSDDVGTALTDSDSLSAALSDETGTGLAVFGTSPTIGTPVLTLPDGNGAAPTDDGELKYDRTAERLQVGDGSGTSEFVKVGTLTDTKFCTWNATNKAMDCDSTGGGTTLTDSASLSDALSDETGTGAAVFGTSPTIATPVLTLPDGNGAAPTTDGQVKYDRTSERLQAGDGSGTSEFVKVGTLTDTKVCVWDDAGKAMVCNSDAGTSLSDSASLSDALSDETGTGAAVFGTSPTIATPVLTLPDGNGAAPTTDGQAKYDRTSERLQVGDGSGTSEFIKVGTLTDTKICIWNATNKAMDCDTTDAGTVLTDSASLSDALSDETGSGAAVFGTSPTIATPVLTLPDGNGAAPTTDGQAKYDRTTERLQVGDGSGTSEFVKVGTLTDTKLCAWNATNKAMDCDTTASGSLTIDDVFDNGQEIDSATCEGTPLKISRGSDDYWLICVDSSGIPTITAVCDAGGCDTIPTIATNKNYILYDEEGDAAIETIDPDAASTLAMYQYGAGYGPIKSVQWGASDMFGDGTECDADPTDETINGVPAQGLRCPMTTSETDGTITGRGITLPGNFDKTQDVLFDIAAYLITDSGAGTWYGQIAIDCVGEGEAPGTFGTAATLSLTPVAGDTADDEIRDAAGGVVDTDTTGADCDPGDTLYWQWTSCDTDATPSTGCTSSAGFENDMSIFNIRMEYSTTSRSE